MYIRCTNISHFPGSIEHRAQVAIYTLMMSERHGVPIDSGLLFYLKTGHMESIPVPEQEKRAILIKRNEIARQLTLERESTSLSMPGNNQRFLPTLPYFNAFFGKDFVFVKPCYVLSLAYLL